MPCARSRRPAPLSAITDDLFLGALSLPRDAARGGHRRGDRAFQITLPVCDARSRFHEGEGLAGLIDGAGYPASFGSGFRPLRLISARAIHPVFQVESLVLGVKNRGGEGESGLALRYQRLELNHLKLPSCSHIAA